MNKDDFEKLDEEFMDRLKTERQKSVSPGILKGFSASVMAKISERGKKTAPVRSLAPVWVPAFAVILLASAAAVKIPFFSVPSPAPYLNLMIAGTADLSEEISALEDLGVWGDEDREILGVSDLEVASE